MNTKTILIKEIENLPETMAAEVLDFVRFLEYKKGGDEEKQWMLKMSEKSFGKIWDNPEDDIYNELL